MNAHQFISAVLHHFISLPTTLSLSDMTDQATFQCPPSNVPRWSCAEGNCFDWRVVRLELPLQRHLYLYEGIHAACSPVYIGVFQLSPYLQVKPYDAAEAAAYHEAKGDPTMRIDRLHEIVYEKFEGATPEAKLIHRKFRAKAH